MLLFSMELSIFSGLVATDFSGSAALVIASTASIASTVSTATDFSESTALVAVSVVLDFSSFIIPP